MFNIKGVKLSTAGRFIIALLSFVLLFVFVLFLFDRVIEYTNTKFTRISYRRPLASPTPEEVRKYYFTGEVVVLNSNGTGEKLFEERINLSTDDRMTADPVYVESENKIYFTSGTELFFYNISTKEKVKIYQADSGNFISYLEYVPPNYLYVTESYPNLVGSQIRNKKLIKKIDLNTNKTYL